LQLTIFFYRKHFPYEDYDEWLFGEEGLWQSNSTVFSFPEILVVHVGLHTCIHALAHSKNETMVIQHEEAVPIMMKAVYAAIRRTPNELPRTQVIIQLPGRAGGSDARVDGCSRRFNRILAKHAHLNGFSVFEREEIERRLLFKSEFLADHRSVKPLLHLENPGPNIVGTSLLALINCLARNGSDYNIHFSPKDALTS
jgi:hypothetical protein